MSGDWKTFYSNNKKIKAATNLTTLYKLPECVKDKRTIDANECIKNAIAGEINSVEKNLFKTFIYLRIQELISLLIFLFLTIVLRYNSFSFIQCVLIFFLHFSLSYYSFWLRRTEILNRIGYFVSSLNHEFNSNSYEFFNIPYCSNLKYSDGSILIKVFRDQKLIILPVSLLVDGDIIQLEEDEILFFPLDIIPIHTSSTNTCTKRLFKIVLPHSVFILPFVRNAIKANSYKSNSPLNFNTICFILAFILIFIRFDIFGAVLGLLPSALFIQKIYENSRLIANINNTSKKLDKNTFKANNDDFEISTYKFSNYVPTMQVLEQFVRILFSIDRSYSKKWLIFNEDKDFVSELHKCSIIAFLDREGTLVNPMPCLNEIIIPSENEAEFECIELISDMVSSKIEFVESKLKNTARVRALGLSCLLCSQCNKMKSNLKNEHPLLSYRQHLRAGNLLKVPSFLNPSFQICFCPFSYAVGFDDHLKFFLKNLQKSYQINSNSIEEWIFQSSVFFSGLSPRFNVGPLLTIVEHSNMIWTGTGLIPITNIFKWKINDLFEDLIYMDRQIIAFSFSPITNSCNTSDKIFEQMTVWLGAMVMDQEPKKDVQEFIEILEQSAIRFVYFSPRDERRTKAFGEKLGLQTDWNACILLSDDSKHYNVLGDVIDNTFNSNSKIPGYSSASDLKTRMPRGIKQIRKHIQEIDDIPLRVSIFAESHMENQKYFMMSLDKHPETISSISNMCKIYLETNEHVILISNLLSGRYIENEIIFSELSQYRKNFVSKIGMLPNCLDFSKSIKNYLQNNWTCGLHLLGLRCSFFMNFEDSQFLILELISISRQLVGICRLCQIYILIFSFMVSLSMSMSSGFKTDLPQYYPLISLFLFCPCVYLLPYHDKILQCENLRSFYFFRRISVPIIAIFLVYFFYAFITSKYFGANFFSGIAIILSGSTLLIQRLYANSKFCTSSFISSKYNNLLTNILLHGSLLSVFLFIDLLFFDESTLVRFSLRICLVFLIFCIFSPLINILNLQLVSLDERIRKRAKLEFNTRLGMHSPM